MTRPSLSLTFSPLAQPATRRLVAALTFLWCSSVHVDAQVQATLTKGVPELADFSYAGYGFGAEGIPDTDSLGLRTFPVTEFGAVPDDGESDREAIESAIHAAAEAGGGVVQFPLGTFRINEKDLQTDPIEVLHKSNIVLRGTRSGKRMTKLFMRYPLYPKPGSSTPEAMFVFRTWGSGTRFDVISDSEPGDREVTVSHVSGLAEGDFVLLNLENAPWLNDRFLEGRRTRSNWSNINNHGVTINEMRRIQAISEGNRIRFHAPLTVKIDSFNGFVLKKSNAINHIGFEDIHFAGNYTQAFQHHQPFGSLGPWYHDDSFKMILVLRGYNSWIRRCTFSNISSPWSFGRSIACSALNNSYEGNPGHNWGGFAYGSARCLDGLSEIKSAVWHGPSLNNATACVSWRTNAPKVRGVDFHGSTVRVSLVDHCVFRFLSSHGSHYSNLPNHLDGAVFWNYKNVGASVGTYNFWGIQGSGDYPARATIVGPDIIGYHGASVTFKNAGAVLSQGVPVRPASLYEAQLSLRLGSTPAWIAQAMEEHREIYGDVDGAETGVRSRSKR